MIALARPMKAPPSNRNDASY